MKSPQWTRRSMLGMGIAAVAGLAGNELVAETGPGPAPSPGPEKPTGAASGVALWRLSASELAVAIRRREVSCLQVVEAHLERIEAVNGISNAVAVVLAESARRAAEAADRELARGASIGPLHGVPMTVKENVDLAGSATTEGISLLRDNVAGEDSPHVAQLKRAGAIPIARSNLPDLGLRWHTDSGLRGATRNPWSAARTPGGSSGGDAVAVATGMTPLGIGNDYGGSLRYPAQCCGIAALRPSRGRVPFFAASQFEHEWPPTLQLFAVQGPMARRVDDLRLALDAMSGPDARDPGWVPAPLRGFEPMPAPRVALVVDPGRRGVDAEVAAGVRRAARALAEGGYAVEEVEPPAVLEAARLWNQLVASELHETLAGEVERIASSDAARFLRHFLTVNPRGSLPSYIAALARRRSIERLWRQFFERFALVLGPVSTLQPFAVGRDLEGLEEVRELLDSMRLVVAVNLLGLPAVAVPAGLANGIPQAVQVIAPIYREDLCLDAAAVIERALGTLAPIDPPR